MSQDSPYRMTIGLRILEHLGPNLYSNAAAVISEAVANAWDADATKVVLNISTSEIVVSDNGTGMSLGDINERFLFVGYDKRRNEGSRTARGRSVMGRKGIGKLALFSVARTVVVSTNRNGEEHCFRLDASEIEDAVKAGTDYRPQLSAAGSIPAGTKLVLSNLNKRGTRATVKALRKRIARRFTIIGGMTRDQDTFEVEVNGVPIGWDDRDDLKAIEFLWEFGDEAEIPASASPNVKHRATIDAVVDAARPGWIVSGWLGAASKPKKLYTEDSGLMKGIVVIARGRLIQENILDHLGFSMLLGNYITGQVNADFLDTEEEPDIATSDRQRLIEDDERYVALKSFLYRCLNSISTAWAEKRNELRGKDATSSIPVLAVWVQQLPPEHRGAATRTLGVISSVDIENEADRMQLYRAGVVAFERLRLIGASERLASQGFLTVEKLLPLLSDMELLEGALYRDIVDARLKVITALQQLVDNNEIEKVLQNHLFQNLWLLDPGWERAAGSERIEQTLKRDYREFSENLSEEESRGRVDIRYKTNAGSHVVVELKRAGRTMALSELMEQGQRYKVALLKCLTQAGYSDPHVSIVFVIGKPLLVAGELGQDYPAKVLEPLGARVVYYEQLIQSARSAYGEFLSRSKERDRISDVVASLGASTT